MTNGSEPKAHFSPRPGVQLCQFSFADVLQAKNRIGHIDKMMDAAMYLGYEYFLWNDRLYFIDAGKSVDTGLTRSVVA